MYDRIYALQSENLHAASTVLAGHSVERLESTVSGRVRNLIAVRPPRVVAHALGDALVHVAVTVLVAHDVGAGRNCREMLLQILVKVARFKTEVHALSQSSPV